MPLKRDQIFSKIGDDLTAMSKVVFKQMQYIKEQLEAQDIKSNKQEIDQNELILDGLEIKLRRNITNAMVLYCPRASDLRKLMSCYDICLNLERMGDLLRNIHKHLLDVNYKGVIYLELKENLVKIYSTMETMVRNAIYSYSYEDAQLTRSTIELDDVVDGLYREIRLSIIMLTQNKEWDGEQIKEILSISDLSYNIERIADYATNIIEASVYLIEGKNIQHQHNN